MGRFHRECMRRSVVLLSLLIPCVLCSSQMQAAKLQVGEAAWAVMTSQEKRAAVIAAQASTEPTDGPMLMLEGPAFSLNEDELTINGRPIVLDQDTTCTIDDHAVRTSHRVWDCAVVLAKMLEHNPALVSGKRIVELGAGQGIVGIAAAMLGADVMVTDHPGALESLEQSIGRNQEGVTGTLNAAALDWTNLTAADALGPPYELLLLADVVWVMELIVPLVGMMRRLSGPATVVYFAYQSRSRLADETLFEALKSNQFQWEEVKEDQFHPQFTTPKITVYQMSLEEGM